MAVNVFFIVVGVKVLIFCTEAYAQASAFFDTLLSSMPLTYIVSRLIVFCQLGKAGNADWRTLWEQYALEQSLIDAH